MRRSFGVAITPWSTNFPMPNQGPFVVTCIGRTCKALAYEHFNQQSPPRTVNQYSLMRDEFSSRQGSLSRRPSRFYAFQELSDGSLLGRSIHKIAQASSLCKYVCSAGTKAAHASRSDLRILLLRAYASRKNRYRSARKCCFAFFVLRRRCGYRSGSGKICDQVFFIF